MNIQPLTGLGDWKSSVHTNIDSIVVGLKFTF